MTACVSGAIPFVDKKLSCFRGALRTDDDLEIVISAAVDGVGLAFMAEENAAQHLASGALVQVLEDWCQPYPGFFVYYPSRRQQPAALSALINALRL